MNKELNEGFVIELMVLKPLKLIPLFSLCDSLVNKHASR